jgi:SAM-dependent methyltransferase
MTALRRAYLRLAVSPDPFYFDPRLEGRVQRLCDDRAKSGWVLNLGSGKTRYGARTINLDIQAHPAVQVRADGHRLPFRDAAFSGVLLRGVLEHVHSAETVRDEALRVLKPKGFLYIEVPFLQPYHLSPEDHRRFTLPGLRSFLDQLTIIDSGVQIGPGSTLAWVLRETCAAFVSFGSERAYRRALTLVGWATFWLKYLDRVIVSAPHVAHSASAVYLLGEKRGA